jgi:hypothetical protein
MSKEPKCACGHDRSSHANGLWECRWCSCKEFKEEEIPDIFEEETVEPTEGYQP